MKALGVISTTALFLLLGSAVPAFAQEEHHDQEAKPEKQQEAKPEKQQQEAKPAKQEEHAKPEKQQEQPKQAKQEEEKQNNSHQQSKSQYAHDGQKDSHGHVYTESRFGRDHHARFVATGGRMSNGRREYSYGGYWFYAGAYPAWFYQQDVYFVMGADGLWYAVAYNDPSLTFEVNIG